MISEKRMIMCAILFSVVFAAYVTHFNIDTAIGARRGDYYYNGMAAQCLYSCEDVGLEYNEYEPVKIFPAKMHCYCGENRTDVWIGTQYEVNE